MTRFSSPLPLRRWWTIPRREKADLMKANLTRRQFVTTSTLAASLHSATTSEFESKWRGKRVWIGPEYWANPLQDWRLQDDAVFVRAGENRTLHVLTHRANSSDEGFWMSVRVTPPADARPDPATAPWQYRPSRNGSDQRRAGARVEIPGVEGWRAAT